ncbi:unnamed protein product [Pleuronectes platessa]|uniref:BZIP domain-containing protein n=1 Tax=Pleuronectes platessa TaxID=8262 RepID=A0A9N7V2L5_PLEPL|nr:unnamed protein product [Pleuronectes platessa]
MSTIRSPGAARAGSSSCSPSSSSSSSSTDPVAEDPGHQHLFSVLRPRQRPLRLRTFSSSLRRRRREMTPDDMKDSNYWDKRRKNNEAAKRSRDRRRLSDLVLEDQLLTLSRENSQLRAHVLSLQYQSLRAGAAEAAAAAASTWSSSPALTPALLPPGLCMSTPGFPVLGARHQETASHPFPCFGSNKGAAAFSPPGSAEAEMEARRQGQVSSSEDIPTYSHVSAIRAHGVLHRASTPSHAPVDRLLPHPSPSEKCDRLLLPWWSFYGPRAPLYLQQGQGQGAGVEADFKSRVSSAAAGLSQVVMHLSPDRRYY